MGGLVASDSGWCGGVSLDVAQLGQSATSRTSEVSLYMPLATSDKGPKIIPENGKTKTTDLVS